MPYRYDKLRGRIIEKCGSQAKFADKIGLSQNSVSRKLNCDVGFSQTDIADLEEKRKDLNQEIADWERKLDLLKEFTRKKNELLQADVNKYLNFATAKLFRPLLNGDTEECCDFAYNGEAYARNLNHGARMLTEVDICRAFQKVASVNFPIIIDDTSVMSAISEAQLLVKQELDLLSKELNTILNSEIEISRY